MSPTSPPTATDSASVPPDSTATRHDTCGTCHHYEPPQSKSWRLALHCTTCHQDHDHLACSHCGACMPAGHRYDKRYCNSSCRAKATKARELQRLERSAWAEENPKEAAKEAAEKAEFFERLCAIDARLCAIDARSSEDQTREQRAERARWSAEECGKCGRELGDDDTVYRRLRHAKVALDPFAGPTPTQRVVAVCEQCRCPDHECPRYLCARCYWWSWDGRRLVSRGCPDAADHPPGDCCGNCHPRRWRAPAPCEGCGRTVVNHEKVRPGWKAGSADEAEHYSTPDGQLCRVHDPALIRTFCSESCRRRTFADERRQKCRAATGKPRTCPTCRNDFTGRRADSRYCSTKCRQSGYRQRRAAEESELLQGNTEGGAA